MKELSSIARQNLAKHKSGAAWLMMVENKDYLNFSGISKNYFGHTAQWMLQRLHGYLVNGKKARFTSTEYAQLSQSLRSIAERLNKAADEIDSATIIPEE